MAQREVIEILKKYLLILKSEGIDIDKAYLYGSYLTETASDDSDIDLMLVTQNDDDYNAGKIWSLTRRVNTRIEPFLINTKKFQSNEESPLIQMIKTTGLEIV